MHRKFEDWYVFYVELFSYVYKEYAMHFLTVFFIYITKFKANNFESIIENNSYNIHLFLIELWFKNGVANLVKVSSTTCLLKHHTASYLVVYLSVNKNSFLNWISLHN